MTLSGELIEPAVGGTLDGSPQRSPRRATHLARRLRRAGPTVWIFIAAGLVLAYQVLVPLVTMIWTSFSKSQPGETDFFSIGSLSTSNYSRAFSAGFARAAWNTVEFTAGVTVVSLVLGGFLAWVVVRTNTPLRKLITALCLIRLLIPGVLPTVAWISLANPSTGILNQWLRDWFPWVHGAILNVYSMPGMIWVESLDAMPLAFLLLSAALRSTDPSMEEASLISGASRLRTTLRITFPVILPAVLGTLILTVIRGFETFEVPVLIGLPGHIITFVVEVYTNTTGVPSDTGLASVYAVLVLAFCVCLIWLYNRLTRNTSMFTTVSGKAFRPRPTNLGGARWATLAVSLLILLFSIALPLLVLVWASFSPPFQPIQPFTAKGISHFTLANYSGVFHNDTTVRAFVHSTVLAAAAALIVVLLISIVAWITVKTKVRGRKILDYLAFAPIAIPSVLMGVSFLWFYVSLPVPIYGTLWILLLLYIARFTPVAMRVLSASMTQIDNELLEASMMTGSSWWRAFRTVALPLLKPGLLASALYVGVLAFRELSASIFVYTGGNEVVGVTMFSIWGDGSFTGLAAFGMLVLLVVGFVSLIATLVSSRFGVRK